MGHGVFCRFEIWDGLIEQKNLVFPLSNGNECVR